jgi:hypothetical protein
VNVRAVPNVKTEPISRFGLGFIEEDMKAGIKPSLESQ